MIRSLGILPRERRLALHMAAATSPDATLVKPRRRCRLWHFMVWAFLTPSGVALALIAAWQILRRGL